MQRDMQIKKKREREVVIRETGDKQQTTNAF
jgi:hypothetical protein